MIDDQENGLVPDETTHSHEILLAEEPTVYPARRGTARNDVPLPWIGALRHPRIGPMVVLDDSGDYVPLYTAGDLLRGFRSLWRISQE